MKKLAKIFFACLLGVTFTACTDHVPSEEALPVQKIDFSYEVQGEQYTLDYYVGATIRFYATVPVETELSWDFGDGETAVGDYVTHKFIEAGHYKVTVTGNGSSKTNVLYVSDIKPIVTQINDVATVNDGLVEVGTSYVSFNVELPNPDSLAAIYNWTFPAGTTDEQGNEVANFVQKFEPKSTTPDQVLGKVKFAKVGSQAVKLQVQMQTESGSADYRSLELVTKNVQVALNEEAPTVYYAVKDGTINALKIPASRTIEGVVIEPYDMGVSSGQHMLNLVYNEGLVYMLDCGKQFTYINDVDGVKGDGKIQVMSVDATSIEMAITNVGGTAFKDPYYGYTDGENFYFADRNTGFRKMPNATRNAIWNDQSYPSYVENNWLGYYATTSMVYGSFNACFGKVGDVWYWCKKDNGAGVWRFTDADNNGSGRSDWKIEDQPAAGQLFEGTPTTAYVYDAKNNVFYFAFYGEKAGIYRIPADQLEQFHPNISDASLAAFQSFHLTFEDGGSIKPIVNSSAGEGNVSEYIGVCQMALDEQTGDVYFGYRSSEEEMVASGLIRYNAETGKLEHVIKGVKIYGIAINPVKSKLFN